MHLLRRSFIFVLLRDACIVHIHHVLCFLYRLISLINDVIGIVSSSIDILLGGLDIVIHRIRIL